MCNDSHYVVVDKTKKKGKYILFDPANGKRVVDFLELKNGYKDILVSVIPSRNIKKIKKTKFKIEVKFSQFMIAIMLMLNLRSTNKTQIIITHRLSSIRDTDYIYVLNRGSIIEQGTHLDLMKKKGWYFESIQ